MHSGANDKANVVKFTDIRFHSSGVSKLTPSIYSQAQPTTFPGMGI